MFPIQRWYSVPSFGRLSTKFCVAQVWCLMEGSKVSYHCRCLVWNKHKIWKSVGYQPSCRAQGEDHEDVQIVWVHRPSFWPIYFEMCPNFNGARLPCTYGPVDVIHTCFIDSEMLMSLCFVGIEGFLAHISWYACDFLLACNIDVLVTLQYFNEKDAKQNTRPQSVLHAFLISDWLSQHNMVWDWVNTGCRSPLVTPLEEFPPLEENSE